MWCIHLKILENKNIEIMPKLKSRLFYFFFVFKLIKILLIKAEDYLFSFVLLLLFFLNHSMFLIKFYAQKNETFFVFFFVVIKKL
jgi:hypothetical protein